MKKWIEYPDGAREEMAVAVSGESEQANRWAPITYLRMVAEDRPWSGKAGVTRALSGMREQWLRYHVDYAVELDGEAFKLVGIYAHDKLDNTEQGDFFETEVSGEIEGVRMRRDLVERTPGGIVLTDYKVVGSFKIVSLFGIVQKGRKEVVGPDGKPVLLKRKSKYGNVGDPKTEPAYVMDPSKADIWDYAMQTNIYRIAWEREHDEHVDSMKLFLVARDGGTSIARARGITRRTYYLEVPRYKDDKVVDWFVSRGTEFAQYMNDAQTVRDLGLSDPVEIVREAKRREVLPPPCDKREAWDGRKCKGFCPVADACISAGDNPYVRGGTDPDLEDF